MVTKTLIHHAFKELGSDGMWTIYFNPQKKPNGYYYYNQVSGFIDREDAKKIVKLFDKDKASLN